MLHIVYIHLCFQCKLFDEKKCKLGKKKSPETEASGVIICLDNYLGNYCGGFLMC